MAEYFYCGVHGETYDADIEGCCPACKDEQEGPLEPGDPHYPDDEEDGDDSL